jgi:hypothetical protein
MTTPSIRRALAVGFLLCACAIVGACDRTSPDDAQASSPVVASGAQASQAVERNELQDWAQQAVSASADATQHASRQAAHDTTKALATPVIHTVD